MDIRVGSIWTAGGVRGGCTPNRCCMGMNVSFSQSSKFCFPEILDSKISKFICLSKFWISKFQNFYGWKFWIPKFQNFYGSNFWISKISKLFWWEILDFQNFAQNFGFGLLVEGQNFGPGGGKEILKFWIRASFQNFKKCLEPPWRGGSKFPQKRFLASMLSCSTDFNTG